MTAEFTDILTRAVEDGSLVKVVLSGRLPDAPQPYEKVTVRPVRLKQGPAYQFSLKRQRQETHENLDGPAAVQRLAGWFPSSYRHAHVFTREADFELQRGNDGGVQTRRRPASLAGRPVASSHNVEKSYLIPDDVPCPFLVEIGVMTPSGKVRAAKRKKFRQINRFLELVNDVVPSLPSSGVLHVVDFGCGKSSLTFALHHLLAGIHGREVRIVGLDRDERVVESCRTVCEKLACGGLAFRTGDIAGFEGFGAGERTDLVVSLHACDTATDDALRQAVRWNAAAILAVPCCQHEVAGKMHGDLLRAVSRYGILKERFAAIATDALRAEFLERHGYRTQVVEFIDLQHTPKNVLIRAVKRPPGPQEATHEIRRRADYEQLKQLLGLGRLHLEGDDPASGRA